MISELGAQGILRAMALVAHADGRLHESETEKMVQVFTRRVGRAVTQESLDAALTDGDGWRWLAEHGPALSAEERQAVLAAAVHVCIADAELQDQELATLGRLARALQVPGAELRGIMNQVWRAEKEDPA